MGCSVVAIGKDGFTEVLQLEKEDDKIITLYKKISVNKDGMIFFFDGELSDFSISTNNVFIMDIYDLIEMYGSNMHQEHSEYEDYIKLKNYIIKN